MDPTEQILSAARRAKAGEWGVLSTGEQLAAAFVLNRADWLKEAGYTMAEALARLGSWVPYISDAAELLDCEG